MANTAAARPVVIPPKVSDMGGIAVRRMLPRAQRRTIGAWCFVDLAGPFDVGHATFEVGAHPHMGLQTVTWVVAGEVVHRDSLGFEQVLRPGQLNLMTAGHGIAHAEHVVAGLQGPLNLVQLWVAQPDSTRHGPPAFAHHAVLPQIQIGESTMTVLIGEVMGARSSAQANTPLVGAEVVVRHPIEIEVDPHFEYGLLPIDGAVSMNGTHIAAEHLAYLSSCHHSITLQSEAGATRVMLLGGEPFAERLSMHWNFVARTRDELAQAVDDWNSNTPRFGTVHGGFERIPAPPLDDR